MIWTVRQTKHAPMDLGIVNEPTREEAQVAAEAVPQWQRHWNDTLRITVQRHQPLYVVKGSTQH